MKKQQFSDYYLGFDIGTNSVGWCVTDLNYNVLRFNKKDMWGSRLFDEAKTAAERRVQRNSRRRLKRRKWRLNLLEEIFSNEILRVDSNFFRRLKESSLWLEDKSSKEKFTLFNDDNYKDYDFYKQFIKEENVHFVTGKTYDLLSHAHAALVTSGTATLETALFNVPEVVCYRGNWISYQIAKRVISLKYISLVNLIMDAPIVTELIQGELNTKNLKTELEKLLNSEYRAQLLKNYKTLREKLGNEGASERTASLILNSLQK